MSRQMDRFSKSESEAGDAQQGWKAKAKAILRGQGPIHPPGLSPRCPGPSVSCSGMWGWLLPARSLSLLRTGHWPLCPPSAPTCAAVALHQAALASSSWRQGQGGTCKWQSQGDRRSTPRAVEGARDLRQVQMVAGQAAPGETGCGGVSRAEQGTDHSQGPNKCKVPETRLASLASSCSQSDQRSSECWDRHYLPLPL